MSKSKKGFALISTITVMSLLMVISLAMLSLSSVETRTSSVDAYQIEARANARIALIIALGELQEMAGPDQRITATADILDQSGSSSRSKITGVWRSWENMNNYLTSAPGKGYDIEKKERFMGWLVSSPNSKNYSLEIGASDLSVRLAGHENGTPDSAPVYAEKINIESSIGAKKGAYAYAVLDEGVKTNISVHDSLAQGSGLSDVELFMRLSAAASSSAKSMGIEIEKDDEANLTKALTLAQIPLLNDKVTNDIILDRFHSTTPYSKGLLVDVNRGGFKQDLSLATEASSMPSSIKSGNYIEPAYPMPWELFWKHCRQYKEFTYNGGGSHVQANTISTHYDSGEKRSPVLARIQNIISYDARPNPSNPAKPFYAGIRMTPVITLWNPYNVEIKMPGPITYNVASLPFSLQIKVGTATKPWVHFSNVVKKNQGTRYKFDVRSGAQNGAFTFKPGESKVFSPIDTSNVLSGGSLELTPGYRNKGGFFFSGTLDSGSSSKGIEATASSSISLAIKPDVSKDDWQDWAVAYHIDVKDAFNKHVEAPRMNAAGNSLTRFLNSLDHNDTRNTTVQSTQNSSPKPVCASMNVQLQTAMDTTAPSLGLLQTNPRVTRSEYGRYGPTVGSTQGIHKQALALSWIDLSVYAHPDWDDSYLPQIDPSNRGFVASGVRTDTGVPVAQVVGLPLRPLQSLADLQHFNYSSEHRFLPSNQVIGNSVAQPVIESDEVHRYLLEGTWAGWFNTYLYHDFSYTANALLFDRYFFSSIAPRANEFKNNPESSETISDVYRAHRNGTKRLPNSRYIPYGVTSDEDVDDPVKDCDTIASKLLVDGAFNINSTSVNAWKGFLGALNEERMLYRDLYNTPGSISTEAVGTKRPYVISRFAIAGGKCADTNTAEKDQIPEEIFWRGYRCLTQDQIDLLAEKIVEQIKLRGPALSLAEFINRRLGQYGTDTALSRRGALQAALEDPEVTINDQLKTPTASQPITEGLVKDYEDYIFPEAATGYTAFGAPGWVTQADILRPLAPYMTPRSDTFKIRAYGESRDLQGKVRARVWCEMVVQRVPDYLISSPLSDSDPDNGNAPIDAPFTMSGGENPALHPMNKKFGRRFQTLQFRWINEKELNQL